jgi:hypothetical protein
MMTTNKVLALADYFNPNGLELTTDDEVDEKGFPSGGWQQSDIVEPLEDCLAARSDGFTAEAAARGGEDAPGCDEFDDADDELVAELASRAGLRTETGPVDLTLWEQYVQYKRLKFMRAIDGEMERQKVAERVKWGSRVADFWRDAATKGWPLLAEIALKIVTRGCTSVPVEDYFSFLKYEDNDRRQRSSIRMLAARTLLTTSMQRVLDNRFGPNRFRSRRTQEAEAKVARERQAAAAAARGVGRRIVLPRFERGVRGAPA